MSKSRNNAIALAATADETARLLRQAKTDSDPHITYDPHGPPRGRQPRPAHRIVRESSTLAELAEQIGRPGSRRAQAPRDRGRQRTCYAQSGTAGPSSCATAAISGPVLRDGSASGARDRVETTLAEVAAAMHTTY